MRITYETFPQLMNALPTRRVLALESGPVHWLRTERPCQLMRARGARATQQVELAMTSRLSQLQATAEWHLIRSPLQALARFAIQVLQVHQPR